MLDSPCGANAICENAAPGYNCICPRGYSAKPDPKVACEQIDVNILCKTNYDCTNNAECVEGQCFCQTGFVAQGASCVDIDECEARPCGPFSVCTNSPGSFHCECESGYIGAPPKMSCRGKNLLLKTVCLPLRTTELNPCGIFRCRALRRSNMRTSRVLQTRRSGSLLHLRRRLDF